MGRLAGMMALSALGLLAAMAVGIWQTERMADQTLTAIAEHRSQAWISHMSDQLEGHMSGEGQAQAGHDHGLSTMSNGLAHLLHEGRFTPEVVALLGAELTSGDVFRFKLREDVKAVHH